jgi:hypothetical protein
MWASKCMSIVVISSPCNSLQPKRKYSSEQAVAICNTNVCTWYKSDCACSTAKGHQQDIVIDRYEYKSVRTAQNWRPHNLRNTYLWHHRCLANIQQRRQDLLKQKKKKPRTRWTIRICPDRDSSPPHHPVIWQTSRYERKRGGSREKEKSSENGASSPSYPSVYVVSLVRVMN